MISEYPFAFYSGRINQIKRDEQDLDNFLILIKQDWAIRQKINKSNDEDEVIEIAKSAGFNLPKDSFWLLESKDFKRYISRRGWYAQH